MHRIVDTSEICQGRRHGAARRTAAKVSCFKMDQVVSLAVLCEEAENEEYEVRNKRKRFWVHEINLTRNVNGEFSTLFEYLLSDESKFKQYFTMSVVKFQQLFLLLLIIEMIVMIVKFHNCMDFILQYITKVT